MSKRQVAILYTHPLFAKGIACLLEAEPRLQVSCIDARRVDAAEQLRQLQPQVVVIEHDLQGPAVGSIPVQLLGSEKWALTIVLGLRHPEMELFYNRRVNVATPDTLLKAVLDEVTPANRSGDADALLPTDADG
jgi:DNA-binding NarL/FixJ family response regulator